MKKYILGTSVTKRIEKIKQPPKGFVSPDKFNEIPLGEGLEELNPNESTSPALVGSAVDCLTRFMTGGSVKEAFKISYRGASIIGKVEEAEALGSEIKGLDKTSIINAVKLCGFDVCYRSSPFSYKRVDLIIVDDDTAKNISIMVQRSLNFFKLFGPKILDGFTFEGGYTDLVNKGDGDFLTKDVLWDFKVSKNPLSKENVLQLLMYWRMGLHSIHPEFKDIKCLGIFNPRSNKVFLLDVDYVSSQVIDEIETKVIGYKEN
ncbi:MAG: hypothetical protein IJV00_08400 [Clostridia bacterium]|nr:hypothetical protein [Clostridia bacterium]